MRRRSGRSSGKVLAFFAADEGREEDAASAVVVVGEVSASSSVEATTSIAPAPRARCTAARSARFTSRTDATVFASKGRCSSTSITRKSCGRSPNVADADTEHRCCRSAVVASALCGSVSTVSVASLDVVSAHDGGAFSCHRIGRRRRFAAGPADPLLLLAASPRAFPGLCCCVPPAGGGARTWRRGEVTEPAAAMESARAQKCACAQSVHRKQGGGGGRGGGGHPGACPVVLTPPPGCPNRCASWQFKNARPAPAPGWGARENQEA